MILKGYGITLTRLVKADIELVRNWRNSSLVNQYMEFRGHITPEMQEAWFASIDNIYNNYYIIHHEGKKIGLIYGAQIDWDKMETGNGGIFIAEENYWHTLVPVACTFLLMDIGFILGLKHTYVKILRSNARAIQFNTQMGFELMPGQEHTENQNYVLSERSYTDKTKQLRKVLQSTTGDRIEVVIDDPGHPVSKLACEQYASQPAEVKARVLFTVKGTSQS